MSSVLAGGSGSPSNLQGPDGGSASASSAGILNGDNYKTEDPMQATSTGQTSMYYQQVRKTCSLSC